MKLLTLLSAMIGVQIMIISGCGGGGGSGGSVNGGSTTKTATLVFSSYSTSAQIGGFDLTVTLPKEVTIQTDSSGTPLSSVVYLSGQFAGSVLDYTDGVNYSSSSNIMKIIYASTSSHALGEFLTISCNVPASYTPNLAFINYSATFYSPSGAVLNDVYVKAKFN